jgi:hypothetical protein
MTDDEKRKQKMELLYSYEEAKVNLEHLRSKAWELKERVSTVASWLEENRRQSITDYRRKELEDKVRSNLQAYRDAFAFDELVSLVDDLQGAHKRLAELESQKKNLGILT